jgi:hypothetical protein
VDRLWVRKVSTLSRYRLDGPQRALNGANLQFSCDIRPLKMACICTLSAVAVRAVPSRGPFSAGGAAAALGRAGQGQGVTM